jgi:hypothetical protein
MKSVMVNALDLGTVPGLTHESFLKAVGQRFKQTGVPMELKGAPEQIMMGVGVSGNETSPFRQRRAPATAPNSSQWIKDIF